MLRWLHLKMQNSTTWLLQCVSINMWRSSSCSSGALKWMWMYVRCYWAPAWMLCLHSLDIWIKHQQWWLTAECRLERIFTKEQTGHQVWRATTSLFCFYQHWPTLCPCDSVCTQTSMITLIAPNKVHMALCWFACNSMIKQEQTLSWTKAKIHWFAVVQHLWSETHYVELLWKVKQIFYSYFFFLLIFVAFDARFHAADELHSQWAQLLDSDWYWLQWH